MHVTNDAAYLHRTIHRLYSLLGEAVEVTPWTEERLRMGPDGFVQSHLKSPHHTGWVSLCGAYVDKQGRYIRVQHQFAPVPEEPGCG